MSRRRGAAAMDADSEDEDAAAGTSEEEPEEDVSEDDEGDDEDAGPSGRVSGASDALVDVNDTEDEEDEDDEEDEEMFDEAHTVDDVLRSVNDERADGPAPYEILARRKREANEKNREAFRAELRSRGVKERDVEGFVDKGGKSGEARKAQKKYGASELLERHNIDKADLLAANPAFAAFLGAAAQAGAVGNAARTDGPGRGRPKNPRRTRRRVVLDEAAKKLGEANGLYARGEDEWPRAMELLLEVIRLAPNDPDPYHTMAMIHDETAAGHRVKAAAVATASETTTELRAESGAPTDGRTTTTHDVPRTTNEVTGNDGLEPESNESESNDLSASAYLALAARHEKKALDYAMIGALLRPRDVDAWYALALKSRANRNPRAALFCYGEALKNDPNAYAFGDGRGLSNRWAQAELYLEIREPKRALEHLVALYAREPADARVATRLAQVHAELGDFETAEKTLDVFVANTPNAVDLTLINVHAESKMHAHAFAEAAALIETTRGAVARSERERAKRDRVAAAESARLEASERALETGESSERAEALGHAAAAEAHNAALEAQKREPPFPPDLVAKAAMCLLYLNDARGARERLAELRETDPREWHDLWFECGVVCQDVREFEHAEVLFTKLIHEVPGVYDKPAMWARVGECVKARVSGSSRDAAFAAAASETAALEFWRSVARRHPEDVDATLPLAEALLAKGAPLGEVLDALPDERALLRAMTAAQSGSVGKNAAEGVENDDDARAEAAERVRFRAARALALRRRVGGDAEFLRHAVPLIDSRRARGVADAVAARKRKRAARDAAAAKASKTARLKLAAPKSDGVFVGYQKRDRSKPKPRSDASIEEAAIGEEEVLENARAGSGAPITLAVPFELTLSTAHALFLRGDLKGAAGLADEILKHTARESGLEKNQVASFYYLKAHVSLARGEYKAAAEAAKALCERVPNSLEAWALHLAAAERAAGATARATFLRACARADREARARITAVEETAEDAERDVTFSDVKERKELTSRSRAPALLVSGLARCARGDWARGVDAFARCHGVAPDEPLVSLCVSVAAAHHATESDFGYGETGETARRAAAVKAVAFFQRARESRAACSPTSAGEQEGDYNLARGLHQMGLPHLAVPVYEKVLDGKTRAGVPAAPAAASLAFEAAHNLALIYKNAGALSLARDVLRAHATV